MKRCWPFHITAIPAESDAVVDTQGRVWRRTGSCLWTWDGLERHEVWLLREHGPVRCPIPLSDGTTV